MDGKSLMPHLQGRIGHDNVFAEYCGEGTISPTMMIRRGPWKYIVCPADPPQLYHLDTDPLELTNLAQSKALATLSAGEVGKALEAFTEEANVKWDFEKISQDVLRSQRQRRFVWEALKRGKFTSWDYNPVDDGREKQVERDLPNRI
jgi:arylsulfatase A-like enzyme